MDSLKDDEKYIINYSCKKFTNENHGISNYHSAKLDKEGFETGKFVIDKNTFAFIEIERNAFRNTNYNYPLNNNFFELVNGLKSFSDCLFNVLSSK